MNTNVCYAALVSDFTVIIWALSSADMEEGFAFPLKSLWKACIAPAVTSYGGWGQKHFCTTSHFTFQYPCVQIFTLKTTEN